MFPVYMMVRCRVQMTLAEYSQLPANTRTLLILYNEVEEAQRIKMGLAARF